MSLWLVRYAVNLGTFPVSHRTFWVFVWFHCIYSFRFVYVWDTNSRRILYKLPGHDGSVNDVDFHPNELICECTIHSWFHHWSNTSRKAIGKSFAWPKCYFWRIILIHKQCGMSRKVCEIQAGKSSLWYLTLILHFSGRPKGRGPGGYWLVHLSLDWVTWLSCCIFEGNTLLSGTFLHPKV